MITLDKPRLTVHPINSNHQGVEFGVVQLDTSDTQLSMNDCLAELAEEGWSNTMQVASAKAGVRKFLISRKK